MEYKNTKKDRNFPQLNLTLTTESTNNDEQQQQQQQPTLEIQSPKTPTLSRKLKAVSLDSDPPKQSSTSLEVNRDVFSMPNTPKRQIKHKLSCEFDDTTNPSGINNIQYNKICSLTPPNFTTNTISSNLKKFASNSSISGSQTLKTLPEVMTLHDFGCSDNNSNRNNESIKINKTKGLLERRGSNASLTIDLGGSNSSISEKTVQAPIIRLNTAKSVSNLNLSSFETIPDKCCNSCLNSDNKKIGERRKSQEACNNCTIYESIPSKINCKSKCNSSGTIPKRCNNCSAILSTTFKCRRKSLSNENLYIPPCGFCQKGQFKECTAKQCINKGYRKAFYPRQTDLEQTTQLSEDFKLHLQSVQYLQTAGNVLSITDLRQSCEMTRVPKLHSEFWEVPLNLQEKCYVSGSQSRNRYKGVLPNEHSRVHLPGPQDYIHANYIKGPDYTETAYVATQGPMTHTCQDFWDMVWHTNCSSIVMLTGLVEKGRHKCELYFPLGKKDQTKTKSFFYVKTTRERDKFTFNTINRTTTNTTSTQSSSIQNDEEEIFEFEELNEIEFGPYKLKYINEEQLDECIIRHLELIKDKKESRLIRHYWFPNWQDHKISNPEQLLKMAMHLLNLTKKGYDNKTQQLQQQDDDIDMKDISTSWKKGTGTGGYFYHHNHHHKLDLNKGGKTVERRKSSDSGIVKPPIIVHCSAGIGRTGCFLAILNGIQQLNTNLNVDVLAILCSLRLNRGGMVQTAEQYELIHRVLNLYVDLM